MITVKCKIYRKLFRSGCNHYEWLYFVVIACKYEHLTTIVVFNCSWLQLLQALWTSFLSDEYQLLRLSVVFCWCIATDSILLQTLLLQRITQFFLTEKTNSIQQIIEMDYLYSHKAPTCSYKCNNVSRTNRQ